MKLAQITARYIDQPFEKYGCLEFAYYFLADLGFTVPDQVGDLSVANYKALVDRNISRAQRAMIKAFKQIGCAGNTRWPQLGDLLVIYQPREKVFFPAVYVGAGQAMASFIRDGVRVFRLDDHNKAVMARRFDRRVG